MDPAVRGAKFHSPFLGVGPVDRGDPPKEARTLWLKCDDDV